MREWLREIRVAANKNHAEIADEAGISRSYYTNIELGIKTPSVTAAKSIGKALNFFWGNFFENECHHKEHSRFKSSKEAN